MCYESVLERVGLDGLSLLGLRLSRKMVKRLQQLEGMCISKLLNNHSYVCFNVV